jgi:hypothetical protein
MGGVIRVWEAVARALVVRVVLLGGGGEKVAILKGQDDFSSKLPSTDGLDDEAR